MLEENGIDAIAKAISVNPIRMACGVVRFFILFPFQILMYCKQLKEYSIN